MSKKEKIEFSDRFVAEDTNEATRLRLRSLTSFRMCERIIGKRGPDLEPSIVAAKAAQTAWAVKNALGYWESGTTSLNARVLSRYYALLQVSIAEQVASPNSHTDLQEIQKHTESGGHGLFTIAEQSGTFPNNYYVGCLSKGHFFEYAKHRGINLSPVAFGGRPREFPTKPDQVARLVSLDKIVARIPELQSMVDEYLGVPPLSFHVVHDSYRNMGTGFRGPNPLTATPAEAIVETSTYVCTYPPSEKVTLEYLRSLNLPFTDIELVDGSPPSDRPRFSGALSHPLGKYWWECIDLYKSGYSGTSYIVPLWEHIRDPMLLHFIILYALSIVVRYLPALWHEIEDGELDHLRALIEHYLVIVDNVLPRLAIESITGRKFIVVQPGSMQGPV